MVEKISQYVFLLAIGLVLALIITQIISPVTVSGTSMYPTLNEGEKLIAYKLGDNYERGDIIVFKPTDDYTKFYIKRVIGLPNDVIEIKNGVTYINDVILREPYVLDIGEFNMDKYRLKENEYFVMGDNRNNSRDSRYFGPIPVDSIYGKIINID